MGLRATAQPSPRPGHRWPKLQSDLRHLLEEYLRIHQPALLGRLETVAIDDTACTEEQLLALARAHFGNAPHRQPLKIPGQEWREP